MNATQSKDTSFAADITARLADEAKRMSQTAYGERPHKQVMDSLLGQIQKVDYRQKANFEPDDEDAKLKKPHYLIITCEELLELARKNQWGLCRREGFFYSYNGAFWKPLDKDDLKAFLRNAAERMGVERFTAHYTEFTKSLFEQFNELAYLPAPDVDRSNVKVNLRNGTYVINHERQYLRAPDATDFLTHQLPFAFDEQATAPQFHAFLDRVQPDLDCQKLLAEYIGYVFISPGRLKLEKALLLYGTGANGKSVFFEIITALLGSDNVSNYSLQSLTNEPAYCRAHLATKLVNYASEINGKLEADTFKQLASGEPIEARMIRQEPFTMTHYAKLIFNCNELPADVEHSNAYFRRFLIVPFSVTIPEAEQDKQLASKIIDAELSGVFNWVLVGLRRLLKQGRFTDPEAVRQQLEAYKKQSDSVRLFLDESEYSPDADQFTMLKELYQEYRSFCSESGMSPVKKPNFQKRLNGIGIHTERRNVGNVVYVRRSFRAN